VAGAQWALEAGETCTPTGFGVTWQNVSWELESLG
jgi:hypothetical protein